MKARVHHYLYSRRELYDYACRPVDKGGCPGFYDENNTKVPLISLHSFEAMIPGNLSRMTNSQKDMVGCDICIDGKALHSALNNFCRERVKVYNRVIEDLKEEGKAENTPVIKQLKDKRDFMVEQLFKPALEEASPRDFKHEKIKDTTAE